MGVLDVLKKVDAVMGAPRLQVVGNPPQPATCGQDQRLDVLIEEVRELNASVDRLIELQAAALRFAVEQAGPAPGVVTTLAEQRAQSTMDMLPERETGARRKR